MTENRQNKIALYCWANVSSHFAMMQNPKYRGPNFRWEEFAEMAGSYIASTVIVLVEAKPKEEEFIKETCKQIGAQLVTRFRE